MTVIFHKILKPTADLIVGLCWRLSVWCELAPKNENSVIHIVISFLTH